MKECWIFGSGEITDYSAYNVPADAYIIAADGGFSHVKRLGLVPDLLLGDFDSITEEMPQNCRITTVPAEKDDTDMMLAVKTALGEGYESIILCGGLGGRLDHTIANIQTLEYIAEHNCSGTIYSERNIIMLQQKGCRRYKKQEKAYFSLFALTESAEITTRGTKYNLTDYMLSRAFPLGVSNEIIEDHADVEVKSGILLVLFSK